MPEQMIQEHSVSDEQWNAEIAQAELEAVRGAYIQKAATKHAEAEQEEARAQALQGWIAAGLGSLPLPESRQEFDALPMQARLQLQAQDAGLYQLFCPPQRLPAELEARMRAGKLVPAEDGPVLEQLGHLQEAQKLKESILAEKLAAFEASSQAALDPEARAQQQAEAEQRRLESEAQAHYQARGTWLGSVQSGTPNRLVADAIRLGQIQPGAR